MVLANKLRFKKKASEKADNKKRIKRMNDENKTDTTPAPEAAAPTATAEAPKKRRGRPPKDKSAAGAEPKRERKHAPFKLLNKQQGFFVRPKKWQEAVDSLTPETKKAFLELLGEPSLKTIFTELDLPAEVTSTGGALKYIKKNAEKFAKKNLAIVQVRDTVRIDYEEKVIKKTKARLVRGDKADDKAE